MKIRVLRSFLFFSQSSFDAYKEYALGYLTSLEPFHIFEFQERLAPKSRQLEKYDIAKLDRFERIRSEISNCRASLHGLLRSYHQIRTKYWHEFLKITYLLRKTKQKITFEKGNLFKIPAQRQTMLPIIYFRANPDLESKILGFSVQRHTIEQTKSAETKHS